MLPLFSFLPPCVFLSPSFTSLSAPDHHHTHSLSLSRRPQRAMPRRSTRQKPRGPPKGASTRQRRLVKKQVLLDQQSYDPQLHAHPQSEDEQSQNEHYSFSPSSSSQPPSDMPNHTHSRDEDINIDHTSDSFVSEIFDIGQYWGLDSSHTASEHALDLLLLASPVGASPTPRLERSASPSPSPARTPPLQLPTAKGTHHYQKSRRTKEAAPKQAIKPALKRSMNKRNAKPPAVRSSRQQKRIKRVTSTSVISDDHDTDHDDVQGDDCVIGHNYDHGQNENENEDDDEDGEDDTSKQSLTSELPISMPMLTSMPHPHFFHHHMVLSPHFVPDTDIYLHPCMAYHDLQASRNVLLFQYNAAAREAVAGGEPWGFLWFNSDWMEQRAASVLVEFKRLPLAHVAVPVPVPVTPMYPVAALHPYPQLELHDHCIG